MHHAVEQYILLFSTYYGMLFVNKNTFNDKIF